MLFSSELSWAEIPTPPSDFSIPCSSPFADEHPLESLMEAVRDGNVQRVKELVETRADVNEHETKRNTPLLLATDILRSTDCDNLVVCWCRCEHHWLLGSYTTDAGYSRLEQSDKLCR